MSAIFGEKSAYNNDKFQSFLENNSINELHIYGKNHIEQRKKIEEFVKNFFDGPLNSSSENLLLKATFLLQENSEIRNIIDKHGVFVVEESFRNEVVSIIGQINETWRSRQINKWIDPDKLSLYSACQSKDEKLIKKLIKINKNINSKDNLGNTSFHYYCKEFDNINPKVFKLFIRAGADLNEQNQEGDTPLHLALKQNKINLAQYLINNGASLEIKNNSGKTPLDLLCDRNQEKKALVLLKNFCEKANLDPFEMSLRMAQYQLAYTLAKETKQSQDVIRILESSKQTKTTPINISIQEGNSNLVNFFLQNGVSVNQTGQKILENAILYNLDLETMKKLIESGALLNEPNEYGNTPLHFSLLKLPHNCDQIKLLIESGASLNHKNMHGCTPLHNAINYKVDSIEIINLLIGNGSPLLQKDSSGNTPLQRAILMVLSNLEIIKLLIGDGKALNIQNNEHHIPLHYALQLTLPNLELVKLLIDAGSNLDLPNDEGMTSKYIMEVLNINLPVPSQEFKFTREFKLRKLMANAWTLACNSSFQHPDMTTSLEIPLEGGFGNIGIKETLRLFQLFINHPKQKENFEKSFDFIQKISQDGSSDPEKVLKKFMKGKPLRFNSGWSAHAVSVIIIDDLLLICNRGGGRKKASIKTYKIDRNKSNISVEDIKKIQRKTTTNEQEMIKFIYKTLPNNLGKKNSDRLAEFINKACRQKDQKIGNCWWVSSMSGIFATLLMEKLLPLDQMEFESEEDRTKAFQVEFDKVQALFKQFSEFTRLESAKEYMERDTDVEMGRDHQLIKKIVDKLRTKKWQHLFEEDSIGKVDPLFKKDDFFDMVEQYKKKFNLDNDFNPIIA